MSALPSKYVPIDYSILGIAALIFAEIRMNDTVSTLWDRLSGDRRLRTFDRFAAALTLLYAGGLIEMDRGILKRVRPENAPQ